MKKKSVENLVTRSLSNNKSGQSVIKAGTFQEWMLLYYSTVIKSNLMICQHQKQRSKFVAMVVKTRMTGKPDSRNMKHR